MATTHHQDLSNWIQNNLSNGLADVLASQLANKTPEQINGLVVKNGPMYDSIVDYLCEKSIPEEFSSWGEFTTTFAKDKTARSRDPSDVASSVANVVLHTARTALSANESQVHAVHAAKALKETGEQPVFQRHATAAIASRYENDLELYHDIMEDAMYNQLLGRKIIFLVKNGGDGKTYRKRIFKKKKKRGVVHHHHSRYGGGHPLYDYYRGHYYNSYGKIPPQALSKEVDSKVYTGDATRATEMFHLFSGRPAFPTVSDDGPPPLIKGGATGKAYPTNAPPLIKGGATGKAYPTNAPPLRKLRAQIATTKLVRALPRDLPIGIPIGSALYAEEEDEEEISSDLYIKKAIHQQQELDNMEDDVFVDTLPTLSDF